ncbi:hypothetical protein RI054_06g33610 [Pseudoscourfieldia marina]
MKDVEAQGDIKSQVSDLKTALMLANYQNAEAPPEPQGVAAIVKRELKQRWWLWLAVGFIACTLLALSGMSGHMYKGISDPGMPELAVQQENGAACKESCDSQAQLQGENSVASGSALAADAVNTGSDIVEVAPAFNLDACLKECLDSSKREVKEEHDEAAAAGAEEKAAEESGDPAESAEPEVVPDSEDTQAAEDV